MTWLREDVEQAWQGEDALAAAFAMTGETFRDVPGRRTLRVLLGGKVYFLKLHFGVGWRELLKNWLVGKIPVVGAENEFQACRQLAELGIAAPVPAAYAASSDFVTRRRSFVLCDELAGYTSLEDVTDLWLETPPEALDRHRLLYAVARFARRFHGAGFIHRDFYICHLLSEDAARRGGTYALAVLDLHRARRFPRIPGRWLKRDLAALLYSTLDLGFSHRDWLRFLRLYTGKPLRALTAQERAFWHGVVRRAEALYRQGLRKGLVRNRYEHTSRHLLAPPARQGA